MKIRSLGPEEALLHWVAVLDPEEAGVINVLVDYIMSSSQQTHGLRGYVHQREK